MVTDLALVLRWDGKVEGRWLMVDGQRRPSAIPWISAMERRELRGRGLGAHGRIQGGGLSAELDSGAGRLPRVLDPGFCFALQLRVCRAAAEGKLERSSGGGRGSFAGLSLFGIWVLIALSPWGFEDLGVDFGQGGIHFVADLVRS